MLSFLVIFMKKIMDYYRKHKDGVFLTILILVLLIAMSSKINIPGASQFAAVSYESPSYRGAGIDETALSTKSLSPEIAMDSSESYGEKLRKTSNIRLETERDQYYETKEKIKAFAQSFDGYYTNENEYAHSYKDIEYRTYSITLKVPVDKFEAAVEAVKSSAELENYNVNVYDMTIQYQDLEAYLNSYKKEKKRIESLLDKAEHISDIIEIEEQLSRIQRQIDSYQRQLTNIDRQTDYSVISVSLSEKRDIAYKIVTMTPLKQLVSNIVGSFDKLLVFISYAVGWIVPIGLIWLLWKGYNRVKR